MKNIYLKIMKVIQLMVLVYSKKIGPERCMQARRPPLSFLLGSREAKRGKDYIALRCGGMENRRWKNKYWPIKQRRA